MLVRFGSVYGGLVRFFRFLILASTSKTLSIQQASNEIKETKKFSASIQQDQIKQTKKEVNSSDVQIYMNSSDSQ